MALLKFANKSAYDSASKSTTESTVADVADGTGIVVNGVNVVVNSPSVGDMLYIDTNGYKRWIKFGTLKTSSLASGMKPVGVCAFRAGSKCGLVYYQNAGQKWSNIFDWTVTGYTLDGASHTVNFSMNDATFNNAFTYSASTLADFITQMNTYFSTASNFTGDHMKNGGFFARSIDGVVHLSCLNFYTWQQEYLSTSGLSLNANVGTEVDAIGYIVRNNRAHGWGGANFTRFREVAVGNRTPTSTEGLATDNWPVTETAFETSDYCTQLRSAYGDYDTYVKSCMTIYPYHRGAMTLSDGKAQTAKLAPVTYLDASGNSHYKYNAARYCYEVNVSCNDGDLGTGAFWLPSLPELGRIVKDMTYGTSGKDASNCDKVNQSLITMGGSPISTASRLWSCSRGGWDTSWFYDSSGSIYGGDFSYGRIAVPFTLLKINN